MNILDTLKERKVWGWFAAAGIVYFLKGIGIFLFIPGWLIVLLIAFGICEFVVEIIKKP
jgi:hypothetical protein